MKDSASRESLESDVMSSSELPVDIRSAQAREHSRLSEGRKRHLSGDAKYHGYLPMKTRVARALVSLVGPYVCMYLCMYICICVCT